MNERHAFLAVFVAVSILGFGCEENIITSTKKPRKAEQVADAGAEEALIAPPKVDFEEVEFVESNRSRDPFRPYTDLLAAEAQGQFKSQRAVVLEHFTIDELKLTGIVGRIPDARALIVDPTGKGHAVKRGQFVGRAEIVEVGGVNGTTHELNWRLDRIRENDVVLVREDPNNPDVPSATRVIPLREEGQGTILEMSTN